MTESIIKAHNLTKRFGEVTAVDSINFSIAPNGIVALLGGNGAGKTTTMAMLLGLVVPTSGNIEIFGKDFEKKRSQLLSKMNFSSPYLDLPHRLSVRENLYVYAMLYGILRPKNRIEELSESLEIGNLLKRSVGKLSAGQRTRVALAKALINNPSLLLLDEPTASLDPDTADWVREYIERWRANNNATILLASHNMAEVERLADNVIVLRSGRVVAIDTPKTLIQEYGRENLEEVFLDIARHNKNKLV
tara:strand:+ start:48780 stop:49523 length:744 start_codon:yes stop_codon:yes gene_type:complete